MREPHVPMFNDPPTSPADLENLENFRVERKRFSSTSATMIFPLVYLANASFPRAIVESRFIPIHALPTYRLNAMVSIQENEIEREKERGRERERFEGEN